MAYIYLSYAKADRATAFAMRDVLEQEGFNVWMDENVHELSFLHWGQIQKYIRKAWAFVFVASDAAKKAKGLKRELDFAEKINKPIFQIVTEGEAWEGLKLGVIRFSLGLRLDISDENVKRLHQQMPLTDDAAVPRQISGIDTPQTLRYLLNWAVIAGIVLLVIFRILPLLQDYIGQQNSVATAEAGVLPCTANARLANGNELRYFTEPGINQFNFRTRRTTSDETIYVDEWIVRGDGTWYGVRMIDDVRAPILYMREEDLILAEDCPR